MFTIETKSLWPPRVLSKPIVMLLFAGLTFVVAIGIRLTTGFTTDPAPDIQLPAPRIVNERFDREGIEQFRERLRRNPEDIDAYARLGLGLLQQVRTTGDPSLYIQAEQAFEQALSRDPQQLNALIGQGILALALHDFNAALVWAEQAQSLNPFRAQILGIKVDALVELGRYEDAVVAAQQMVDLRPDLHSYSRVSYLRELHGDVSGAIEAMQNAVKAGVPGTESALWTQIQLAHLYFNRGDLETAERIYQDALTYRPDYAYASAGLARIEAARGNFEVAIQHYEQVIEWMPLPEFVLGLAELYIFTEQPDMAKQQLDLVRVMEQLNAAAGMDVDLEMAKFEAKYGDPTVAAEQAQVVYKKRPTIYAADTLAWALYQQGDYAEAWSYSQQALRLDTQDAALYYHAGMIAFALKDIDTAQKYLETTLTINPHFSLIDAVTAKRVLDSI